MEPLEWNTHKLTRATNSKTTVALLLGKFHEEVAQRPALAKARGASDDNTTLRTAVQPRGKLGVDLRSTGSNEQHNTGLGQRHDTIRENSNCESVNGPVHFVSKKGLPKSGDILPTL